MTTTTFNDDETTLLRTAYQVGEPAYSWTKQQIDRTHKEFPHTVWAWGQIPHWRKHVFSNESAKGPGGSLPGPA